MGFLDRFKRGGDGEPASGPPPDGGSAGARAAEEPDPWDGTGVDWAAAGVPAEAVDLATEIAATPDFGVDPSEDDGYRWTVALFDDVRGLVGDPAIEALEEWLETFGDVDEAVSFDREILEVRGAVERHDLAVRVVARLAATADPTYWDEDTT